MNNGRVLHLFRRLSTGDTRFNTINNKNLHLCRTVDLDRSLLQKRSDSSPQLLPTNNCFKQPVRTMATATDVPGSSSAEDKKQHKFTNRLKYEKSPYLLQHAHNPVDWYPWSNEAFEKAKKENKLIFLSVGYSTCHWCHVMEHESFENEDVAKIMNANFVNIKVDREERPDIDKIYMTFIQATQGGGGWPMSVFLTPDLNPVTGGTYFPPEDKYGRPGFKTILNNLTEKWREDPNHFMEAGAQVSEILKRSVNPRATTESKDPPGEESWKKCILQFTRNFEEEFGGFGGGAPKFPQPCNFNFLFHAYARDKYSEEGLQCLNMCIHTLKKMALGGIHDHIGGGFSRYSVDNKWHVPHFEKMLYDQGQLTVAFCDAFLATKDEFFANVVRDILRYVERDLKHHRGGFYCAEDADSLPSHQARKKVEGAFYVWEYGELQEHLGGKHVKDNLSYADIFCHHFNVKKNGNVDPSQDPHGELLKKNVLIIFETEELTASHFQLSLEQFQSVIKECFEILFEIRNKRPRPHLDSKFLTSWNGLMISGFAKAGQVLNDNNYIDTAIAAANFIRKFMYNEESKELLRSCYRDESSGDVAQIPSPIDGFLDDYAFLIRGLLDLYEASLSKEYLEWAQTLQQTQNRLFWDEKNKGYFSTPLGDDSVILRLKEDQDGAEPSGNSISAHNLLRLSAHSCNNSKDQYRKLATELLVSFSTQLTRIPIALPDMTSSLMFWHDTPTQVFIAGRKDDPETKALLQVVRTRLIPGRVIAISDTSNGNGSGSGSPTSPSTSSSILSRIRPIGGHPAAYVCRHYACSLPVTETKKLAELLDEK